MHIPDDYELLDSGGGRKLERFGPVILSRPCAQAVWEPARLKISITSFIHILLFI